MENGRIIIADDKDEAREIILGMFRRLNFQAVAPRSFEELKKLLAFEYFEGTFFDYLLDQWEQGRIYNRKIEDGEQIAKLYKRIHSLYSISIYSATSPLITNRIENDFFYYNKPFPLSKEKKEKLLAPFLRKTKNARRNSYLYLSPDKNTKMSLMERLRHYKKLHKQNVKWFNMNFEFVSDYSWLIVCGPKIEKKYGETLVDLKNRENNPELEILPSYPTLKGINKLSRERNNSAFICWNVRKTEHIPKQINKAGKYLKNIPTYLHDYFSISLANSCGDAYLEGEKKSISWCENLTNIGVFEFAKHVFKKIIEKKDPYNFNKLVSRTKIPQIAEIYKGQVLEINNNQQFAWIRFENLQSGKPNLHEQFDLSRLKQHGIKYEGQEFEYTIYENSSNDVSSNFELIDTSTNPFQDLLNSSMETHIND